MRIVTPANRRAARGKKSNLAGMLAEEGVARLYREEGAEVLELRRRIGGGELDIVAREGDVIVFVEVKARKLPASESPVSPPQWRRLEQAASAYMMECAEKTGRMPAARFDVALVGRDGRPSVIRNAREFGTC